MIMENEMILTDNTGKETKATIVATFDLNNEKYVAYTDGTKDDDNKDELYVSKYKVENGSLTLIEITSEYEWKQVDKYLDEYLFDEE